MQELLSSPGMMSTFVAVLIIQALSLLMLMLNVQLFRSQAEKYRLLMERVGGGDAWKRPGVYLLPIYIVLILGATAVTTLIFLFQPHIL